MPYLFRQPQNRASYRTPYYREPTAYSTQEEYADISLGKGNV